MYLRNNLHLIHEVNRYLIASLSVIGFFLDGIQPTDPVFITALVLWLWQPEWDQLESKFITNHWLLEKR